MMNNELTKKQKTVCLCIDGLSLIFLGLFLMIVGLGLTVYDFKKIILSAILFFLGVSMILSAFVQKNSLLLWIGSVIFVCSSVGFFAEGIESLGYSNLYPIYISSPAIASLLTLTLSREYRMHLTIALFFGVISLLFTLEICGLLSINIIIPIVLILMGITIIVSAFIFKGEKNER